MYKERFSVYTSESLCAYCPVPGSAPLLKGFGCGSCRAGTYASAAVGAALCIDCPMGSYNSFSGKTLVASCSPCPAGRYCAESGLTSDGVPCPRGTYSPYAAAISDETCVKCPPGSYCPNNGTISPVPCADGGSFSTVSGATTSSMCQNLDCPAGYFCPPGAGSPTACPAGYFSPNSSASSFLACQKCTNSKHRGYSCPGIINLK